MIKELKSVCMSGEQCGGQGLTEYAVILGIVAAAAVASVFIFKEKLVALWQLVTNNMNSIVNTAASNTATA